MYVILAFCSVMQGNWSVLIQNRQCKSAYMPSTVKHKMPLLLPYCVKFASAPFHLSSIALRGEIVSAAKRYRGRLENSRPGIET